MKAMRLAEFGSPDKLRLEEAPDPELRDGHVRIRVMASGINPADLVRMSGRYPKPLPLPYIPGTDVAGEVEALGAGVDHVEVGERVFGRSLNGGVCREGLPRPRRCSSRPEAVEWVSRRFNSRKRPGPASLPPSARKKRPCAPKNSVRT